MKKIIIFLSSILILCGCNRNISTIDFEVQTTTEAPTTEETTTEEPTTEETTTEEPTTNAEVITGENLLQAAMLNEIYMTLIDDPETKLLFKDLYWEWIEFSVVDMNFDGQNDVCLYAKLDIDHYRILYIEENEVMVGAIHKTTIFEDGYGGNERDNYFHRRTAQGPNQKEETILRWDVYSENEYFQHKGKDITKEEFEALKQEYNFSTTPVTKYELTEENIRKYVK